MSRVNFTMSPPINLQLQDQATQRMIRLNQSFTQGKSRSLAQQFHKTPRQRVAMALPKFNTKLRSR